MLVTKTPTAPLFRLGRKPDPWNPPDWSRAQPDGTFGNRFDDPQGNYRVLYAATQRVLPITHLSGSKGCLARDKRFCSREEDRVQIYCY
jgi:hypothetical protein